ncbi:cadherin-like domain-containing protein, partial [Planctomycetota bacterium]|nr:cadherin-like domain-containing protein [Planctomycetota bacterium]
MPKITYLLIFLCASSLSAATFTVTSTADSGAGSLRDAIAQADAAAGPDIIEFNIGSATPIELSTFDLTKGFGKTALVIDSDLTINASTSAFAVTITRAAAAPEMRLLGVGKNAKVSINSVVFDDGLVRGGNGGAGVNGHIIGGGGAGIGGAVYLYQGELILDSCTFSNNQAIGGSGNSASTSANPNGGGGGGSSCFNGGNFTGSGNNGAGGAGIGGDAPNSSGGPGGANEAGVQASGNNAGTLGGGGGGGSSGAAGAGTDHSAGGFGGGGGGGYSFTSRMGAGGFGAGGGANGGAQGGLGGFGGGGGGSTGAASGAPSAYGGGSGNTSFPAHGGGGAGMGGALFNHAGVLHVLNCTFSSNSTTGGTGANAGQALGDNLFARNGATYVLDGNGSGTIHIVGDADLAHFRDVNGTFTGSTTTASINGGSVVDLIVDDSAVTPRDAVLVINSAAGVLGNDATLPFFPSAALATGTFATTQSGSVSLAIDGSYVYTPPTAYVGTDTFTYDVVDGATAIGSATVSIDVILLNQAPVISAPGAQALDSSNSVVLSTANGNVISIADPDIGSSLLQTELSLANGSVALASLTGVTILAGTNGSGYVVFEASLSDINAALDGLQITLVSAASSTLNVYVSDGGATGAGSIGYDSASVQLGASTGGGSSNGDDDDSGCSTAESKSKAAVWLLLLI